MEIIPVIDLLHGQVVRAQRGERDRYQPIRSQLCDSSEPMGVARALLELYPFKSLYIADLDAIQGLGSNLAVVAGLHRDFSGIDIWLDAGVRHSSQWPSGIKCIVGSERLETLDQYVRLMTGLPENDTCLSLDFDASGFMGPPELLQKPELWPRQLICMTLTKVGSYEGPDFGKLTELSAAAGQRRMYAAGGIRNAEDLQQLRRLGIAGALLASSLHDGRIGTAQLAELLA